MLLPVLFACTKEDDRVKNPNFGEGQKFDFTITVSEDPSSITKASFNDELGIYWVAGGKAGIVNSDRNLIESSQLDNDNIYVYDGSQQASFLFSETNAGEYKFFYPYHSEANNETIPFWVDPKQSTDVGNSADCFAVVSTSLVTLDATKHDTPAETHYKVVGSYIRFAPFGKTDEKVKYIITRGEAATVSGRYFVKWDNTFDHYDLNAETVTLSVNGDYTTSADKDAAKGLYVSVLPAVSKNTYTVVTDKGYYVFESSFEKEFKFGAIKDIPLNLEKASRRTPDQLYVIGDATTAGWNGNAAIELTKKSDENKFVAEGIVLVPAKEGFKFNTKKTDSVDAWSNAFVNAGDNKLAYYVDIPDGKDTKFTVDKPGKYNLTVDFDTFTVTTELVEEYPFVSHWNYSMKAAMYPTGNAGEYKATGVIIGGDSPGYHDFKIICGNEFYKPSNYTEIAEFSQSKNYVFECDVTKGDIGETSYNDLTGWWINARNTQNCRYYDFTLDTVNNKLSMRFTQGKNYWLVGGTFGWGEKKDQYKQSVGTDGKVLWSGLSVEANCTFRICGEYTYDYAFYDGEWYYATSINSEGNTIPTDGTVIDVVPFVSDKDNSNWKIETEGKYTFEFDTVNLKLKVTKEE